MDCSWWMFGKSISQLVVSRNKHFLVGGFSEQALRSWWIFIWTDWRRHVPPEKITVKMVSPCLWRHITLIHHSIARMFSKWKEKIWLWKLSLKGGSLHEEYLFWTGARIQGRDSHSWVWLFEKFRVFAVKSETTSVARNVSVCHRNENIRNIDCCTRQIFIFLVVPTYMSLGCLPSRHLFSCLFQNPDFWNGPPSCAWPSSIFLRHSFK